mmetsp:Transcript_9165/g.14891  ORF Transcript_9165/g.14891 Transcript_9165/m.14891 type:complete len:109 (+) Transcript_9165:43-369(+)
MEGQLSRTLHVTNLPSGASLHGIKSLFVAFGDVKDAIIPTDGNGAPKDFALVTFSDAEDAEAAVDNMDESEIDGKVLKVSFAESFHVKDYSQSTKAVWDEDGEKEPEA